MSVGFLKKEADRVDRLKHKKAPRLTPIGAKEVIVIVPHLNGQPTLSPLEIYRRNHGIDLRTIGCDNNSVEKAELFRQIRRLELGVFNPDSAQAAQIWGLLPPKLSRLRAAQSEWYAREFLISQDDGRYCKACSAPMSKLLDQRERAHE